MSKIITINNWWLRKADERELSGDELSTDVFNEIPGKCGWFFSEKALSVHEILIKNGQLDDDIFRGECESCEYVAKEDWIYKAEFGKPQYYSKERIRINFKGIDTYAEFFLNGEHIGGNTCFYLPVIIDITDKLQDRNQIIVYFHSPFKIIELLKKDTPADWSDYILDFKLLRKPNQDFHNFSGANPYLAPIGFYDDVELLIDQYAELTHVDIETSVSFLMDRATLSFRCEISAKQDSTPYFVTYELYDPDGKEIFSDKRPAHQSDDSVDILGPQLWWPRPYGGQPLYTLITKLYKNDIELDHVTKRIGIRKIEKVGDFLFAVNGKEVRLWGANYLPQSAISHRWNAERGKKILRMVKDANMNTLRIWGEQAPPGDSFYEFLDEHGILLWQDFYICTCGFLPDSPAYRAQYLKEIEYMVKKLKHHPSILLWCGNNECLMIIRSEVADGRSYGAVCLTEDIPKLLYRLDPSRFYTPSSPYGAIRQPQDPMRGDMHGYLGVFYEPGVKYPVFYSESCHMCTPPLRSLKRFMKEEELYPAEYTGAFAYPDNWNEVVKYYEDNRQTNNRARLWGYSYWRTLPIPDTWRKYISRFAICENWDIEKYYDGVDLDSLMYKYSAPSVEYIKHSVERVRRGSRATESHLLRRCSGYLFWKLNDSWPYINFTLIDYYLEPVATYYQIKRSYAPIIVSIDAEDDHLYLWGINDTFMDFRGSMRFRVFSKIKNKLLHDIQIPVLLFASRSQVIANLDHLGAISRECVLYADLLDTDGNIIHRTDEFLDLERNQSFPDAKLMLQQNGSEIVVTTDKFARFVELIGNKDGDEFGWEFGDNYFNLFPFETKRIRICGKHTSGIITAKAHYSPHVTQLEYHK